jgi:hypothetical protein
VFQAECVRRATSTGTELPRTQAGWHRRRPQTGCAEAATENQPGFKLLELSGHALSPRARLRARQLSRVAVPRDRRGRTYGTDYMRCDDFRLLFGSRLPPRAISLTESTSATTPETSSAPAASSAAAAAAAAARTVPAGPNPSDLVAAAAAARAEAERAARENERQSAEAARQLEQERAAQRAADAAHVRLAFSLSRSPLVRRLAV